MNLVCTASNSCDAWDNADLIQISISKEYAQRLLQQREQCKAFLKSMGQKYLGKVRLDWESDFTLFGQGIIDKVDEATEDGKTLQSAMDAATTRCAFTEVPDTFDPIEIDPEKCPRIDVLGITFDCDGDMRISAMCHYSSDTTDTQELPLELLQKIANG